MTDTPPAVEPQVVTLRAGDRLFIGTALIEVTSVDREGNVYAFVREAGTIPDEVAP